MNTHPLSRNRTEYQMTRLSSARPAQNLPQPMNFSGQGTATDTNSANVNPDSAGERGQSLVSSLMDAFSDMFGGGEENGNTASNNNGFGTDAQGEFGGMNTNGNSAANNNGYGTDPQGEFAGMGAEQSAAAAPASEAAAPASRATNMGLGEGLLGKGMAGPEVKALQEALRAQGADIKADGIFGPNTEKALKEFQSEQKLDGESIKVDGLAGPETRQSLERTAHANEFAGLDGTGGKKDDKPADAATEAKGDKNEHANEFAGMGGDGKAKDSATAPNNDARATQAETPESKDTATA